MLLDDISMSVFSLFRLCCAIITVILLVGMSISSRISSGAACALAQAMWLVAWKTFSAIRHSGWTQSCSVTCRSV